MSTNPLNKSFNRARWLVCAAWLAIVAFFGTMSANAQIAVQDGSSSTIVLTNGASFGTNFTVTTGAKVLVFMVAAHSGSTMVMPSLSWGAQPMTLAVTTNAGTSYTASAIYYLYNPTPGTVAGADNTWFQVYTLNGVDTTATVLTGQASLNGTPPINSIVTGIQAGSWAAVTIGNGGNSASTLTVLPSGTVNASIILPMSLEA